MFDTLLQLPLFQGLCQEDFANILDKVKLSFEQHKAGSSIVKSGDPCQKLCFLLKGEISQITVSQDQSYTVIEQVNAPYLIEPHSLFGMNTHYYSSYQAYTKADTVSINKEFLLNILLNYDIFRLNYLNIVCNRSQNLHARFWNRSDFELKSRICQFLLFHFEKAQGRKIFKIKMEDLARQLTETRLNVSKALNELQEESLIELHRKEIVIPEAAKLTLVLPSF